MANTAAFERYLHAFSEIDEAGTKYRSVTIKLMDGSSVQGWALLAFDDIGLLVQKPHMPHETRFILWHTIVSVTSF